MIIALCKVQTVNFERLAQNFETTSQRGSSLRGIQRFIATYMLDKDLIIRMIYNLLPHKPPYRLIMDRTNWKFGESDINILVISIAYQGLSFPIIYKLIPGKGASHTNERIDIINHYLRLFGVQSIKELLADREFIGNKWLDFLRRQGIKYHIRVLAHHGVMRHTQDWKRKARCLFSNLKVNQWKRLSQMYYINESACYLSALRFINDKGKRDLLIIASFELSKHPHKSYAIRWQIETMFRALKTSGFNIDKTHLTQMDRIEKLLAIVCIAFIWAYLTGIYIHKKIKKIRMLKHGKRAKSLFKYGLEYIAQWLLNPYCQHDTNPIKFLSCT